MYHNLNSSSSIVLTLDIGTSSLRAMMFDAQAHAVQGIETQIKYEMRTTPDGGSEADPHVMFSYACQAIDTVLQRAASLGIRIGAVGSDQMVSNVLGVDEAGQAITPVYTYADTRAAPQVTELRASLDEEQAHQRVGTLFHTSYLPARFIWLARQMPEQFARVRWWMSLGEYFYLRWLGQRVCSYSTASWTGLLNRAELDWDRELLGRLTVRADQLSPLVDATQPLQGLVPEFASRWPALSGAKWFPALGDGAAANIGSGCVNTKEIALTVGTSSAMRVTVPKTAGGLVIIPRGLWSYRVDRENELVGGALSEGGNLYAWMEETLRLDDRSELEGELAKQKPDAHGLTVLPFLAGERAPGWVPDARAAILGISLNTRPIDLLRAGLEGVAYRLDLIFELLRSVAPSAQEIIASGGALANSPVWVQIIADVLGVPITVSAEPEATSRGTALIALKGMGVIPSLDALPAARGKTYVPDLPHHEIYRAAVKRQQKWYNSLIA